jgi:hypothetical protein
VRRLVLAACLLAPLATAPVAHGKAYLPPAGKVFHGLTGGKTIDVFAAQTGRRPPVFQFFTSFDSPPGWPFPRAAVAGARPMLHVSTMAPSGREVHTPRDIARGRADAWLLGLHRAIERAGEPTYVRLMAEMNGHWNAYSAYSANGRRRGAAHSTAAFRAAWRRVVLIVRGGRVAEIDRRLRRLRLPAVRTDAGVLQRVPVAFLWVPQVAGAPDVAGNAPRAYWPGGAYVDWVGTDFYSKFPNWRGLERFYRAFAGKPFAFGEWAVWGRDDPAFVKRFFAWMRSHPRVRMAMYNQGNNGAGPFRLKRYPRSRRALERELRAPRFRSG